ncbi:MAG: DUF1326 domain-containing protein [Acidobacteriota bacterium]
MVSSWKIRGELVLSCNCDVFCPCVISLGKARPTQGVCHTWFGLHIDEGHAGEEKLDGLNAAVLMDIPGPLADGNWTVALYVDEKASPAAAGALAEILSGKAGGSMGWFSIMISEFLGTKQVPINFEKTGKGWQVKIPKIIDALIEPIAGAGGDGVTKITNTSYWMAPEVTVCTGARSRYRDWGRNWNLTGKSAEYARIVWEGP